MENFHIDSEVTKYCNNENAYSQEYFINLHDPKLLILHDKRILVYSREPFIRIYEQNLEIACEFDKNDDNNEYIYPKNVIQINNKIIVVYNTYLIKIWNINLAIPQCEKIIQKYRNDNINILYANSIIIKEKIYFCIITNNNIIIYDSDSSYNILHTIVINEEIICLDQIKYRQNCLFSINNNCNITFWDLLSYQRIIMIKLNFLSTKNITYCEIGERLVVLISTNEIQIINLKNYILEPKIIFDYCNILSMLQINNYSNSILLGCYHGTIMKYNFQSNNIELIKLNTIYDINKIYSISNNEYISIGTSFDRCWNNYIIIKFNINLNSYK